MARFVDFKIVCLDCTVRILKNSFAPLSFEHCPLRQKRVIGKAVAFNRRLQLCNTD
ncbi:unnamed protein product [Larinioides sclopetarius]|uniref:Uncharacterized protein n=1 Tax=Larinioides sclopetarius TaxID=280406 RepID=A0AAV2ARI3_9ARAC